MKQKQDVKDIVIVGAGGFGREVEWLIERINEQHYEWNFIGFVDSEINGKRVVGDDSFIVEAKRELYVAIAVGSSRLRKVLYEKYVKNPNVHFPNLLDPSVVISKRVAMGIGNIVCAANIITVDVVWGSFNIVNLACTIGHDVKMGDYITINPNCNISGNVTIGNLSEIGTGTQIIQGKEIGAETIVGAGCVVVKDIPGECTVVGVPGKIVKYNGEG